MAGRSRLPPDFSQRIKGFGNDHMVEQERLLPRAVMKRLLKSTSDLVRLAKEQEQKDEDDEQDRREREELLRRATEAGWGATAPVLPEAKAEAAAAKADSKSDGESKQQQPKQIKKLPPSNSQQQLLAWRQQRTNIVDETTGAVLCAVRQMDLDVALLEACRIDHSSAAATVELLLRHKACVNVSPGSGRVIPDDKFPLCAASKTGRVDVLRLLLEHKASVNDVDSVQPIRTPLWFACRGSGNADVARLLLEHNVITRSDRECFDKEFTGKRESVNVLKEAAGSCNPPLINILLRHFLPTFNMGRFAFQRPNDGVEDPFYSMFLPNTPGKEERRLRVRDMLLHWGSELRNITMLSFMMAGTDRCTVCRPVGGSAAAAAAAVTTAKEDAKAVQSLSTAVTNDPVSSTASSSSGSAPAATAVGDSASQEHHIEESKTDNTSSDIVPTTTEAAHTGSSASVSAAAGTGTGAGAGPKACDCAAYHSFFHNWAFEKHLVAEIFSFVQRSAAVDAFLNGRIVGIGSDGKAHVFIPDAKSMLF